MSDVEKRPYEPEKWPRCPSCGAFDGEDHYGRCSQSMIEDGVQKMLDCSMRVYDARAERSAMRCALGDAAAICDLLARMIAIEMAPKNGRSGTTKKGREMAAVAKRCGDEIWRMREGVRHDAAALSEKKSA